MEKKFFIKCMLYSISDDFSINSGSSYEKSILDSKKKYIDTIIAKESNNGLSEVLTGEMFDFSRIEVRDTYSKLLRRFVIKEKVRRSVEPLHVSMFSEELTSQYSRKSNFEIVDEEEVNSYRESVISKYGSIENYKEYLLHLKSDANDILTTAINEYKNQKTLKKRR